MVLDRVKKNQQNEYDDENERIRRSDWESVNKLVTFDAVDDAPSVEERYRALHASDLDLAAKRGDIDAEQQAMEEMP